VQKLTKQQEKFVQELLKGKSQRTAYKTAYPKCRASDKTIDEMASKLFNIHKVYTRYNEIHERLVKEAEDESIIEAKDVLKEIKSIAFDDIGGYLSFRTEKTIVDKDEKGNPVIGYDTVIEVKDSETIDTRNIAEISRGRDGQFKFKLYCRDTALYKLAEILGLSKDNNPKQETAEKLARWLADTLEVERLND